MKKIIQNLLKGLNHFINGLIAALEATAYENQVKQIIKIKSKYNMAMTIAYKD